MPVGPFGEIVGTTGTLEGLGAAANYKSKVIAPRNPKLVRGQQPDIKLKPSQFMFQMSMDTEKKLANMHTMKVPQKVHLLDMAETSHQKQSIVSIDDPVFQPFPSEVYFQNFEPFQTYEVPLTLRNNDKVPRLVKVTMEDSPYFKITAPNNVGHKVGAGLPTVFKIFFTPEEKKDYNHELVCTTEREQFVVPIKAIGARAIMDFPDEVIFQSSPVKHTSSKTLLVRNIGNKEAKFDLITERPFRVSPENGTLPVNESMQVTVDFCPTTVGDHQEDLVLQYDTGENIYIHLYGAAQDANVRLDKNSIRIENTFIYMANQRTITISNRSDVIAHFRWTHFATQEEEDQQKIMVCGGLENEEIIERDRFLEECIQDPSLRDKVSILSRTFQNRRKLVDGDKMFFEDEVFQLEPKEGDIWPNSTVEINVIFKPKEAQSYNCTSFCDITGRESRLPLRIRGEGAGPKVVFSFDNLDMGNIFINSTHTYEVVLANKGDIDAIFSLLPTNSVFGTRFSFNPSEGIVMPDGHQAIQVSFDSSILGDFVEEFQFQIDGSPERLKLLFRGTVIGPTFSFDVPKLKFGMVSYGFVSTQVCTLINSALIPMTFTLRVPGDGASESVSSISEYDSALSEAGSSQPTREFQITPSRGTIPPQSELKVQVDLCSNTVKKYDLAMVVDVEGVGDEVLSLPVTARCIVPQVTVLTPILDYSRCFLRHPYEHNVKLRNDTDLPARYELIAQHVDELSTVLYGSPQHTGILPPHALSDIPLVITAQALGELETMALFSIFGSDDVPLPVQVTCVGEGPVVHIMPLDLDWKQIPVLTDTSKIVRLSNESLIPAKFTAHMVRTNSAWQVEPSSGEIPPESQLELTVTACLDDCIRFQDKLQINIIDGPSRHIPLLGCGLGTTVTSNPPMSPTLNLGPHFCKGVLKRTFRLTNSGRRHQSLVWSTEGFGSLQRSRRSGTLQPLDPKDVRLKDMPPAPAPPKPVFRLTPHRMELNPGDSIDVELEGFVDSPQVVRERMLCHAIIGRAGGKELIMKVAITCEFIAPLLEFSTDQLFFKVDKNSGEELELQTKDLEMTNVSSLPLTVCLSLKYPFQLLMEDGSESSSAEVTLGIGQNHPLQIQFDPAYRDDNHIRTVDEVLSIAYKEHPHVDQIGLRGEVYFPNLDFEKSTIDFGCVLNDTEVTRYINIANNSPMDVHYKWSFLIDDETIAIFNRPIVPAEASLEEEDYGSLQSRSPVDEAVMSEEEVPQVQLQIDTTGAESPRSQPDNRELEEGGKEGLLEEEIGEEKKDPEKPHPEDLEKEGSEHPAVIKHVQVDEPDDMGIVEDKNLVDQLSLEDSRPLSRLSTPRPSPMVNPVLASLLQTDPQDTELGVEEIFDILPLYGTLKPGDTEQITFTFFGHPDIVSRAKAICEVEGGPTYEMDLKGEASLVEYRFDCLDIDYGKQMYDQVAVAEIVLMNTGRVGFEFTALGMDPGMANHPRAGVPIMIPHKGFIEAQSRQILTIKFLPGVPKRFHQSFSLQVAHFEPDTVNLFGEGVFPRISLDLPRFPGDEDRYNQLVQMSRDNLIEERKELERPTSAVSGQGNQTRRDGEILLTVESEPSDLEVQMEIERLVVQEYAQEQQELSNHPDILEVHPPSADKAETEKKSASRESRKSRKKNKPRPRLPDYMLDFGHVVLGTIRTHIVRATNTGWFPASFSVDREFLYQYGFNVELDRVRQLPGAPEHETVDFVVSFDPRGANLDLGEIETVIPINIVSGPQVCIHVKANVTMPDMQISTDVMDFGDVNCGECKVVTVQLHNHKHVRCEWNSLPSDKERKKSEKHVPMHLRRKQRMERNKPRTFEMMPPTGVLLPGQRQNVQVKFMPIEEKAYETRIAIRLAQSSQRILLLCHGQGQEPHIEFDKNLIEFGPILPHSGGDEQDIVMHNPCTFPIEVYNLEFDKTYLEEEKILRLMKGYDEYNTILLPPRSSGDKLPKELLDYYDEQMKKLEEAERVRREAEEAVEAAYRDGEAKEAADGVDKSEVGSQGKPTEDGAPTVITTAPSRTSFAQEDGGTTRSHGGKEGKTEEEKEKEALDKDAQLESASTIGVGELEITPVSASIARHLGIDLTPEGKAARNRRGIAVVVHGAPMSGKTSTAVALAKHYECALLTVDGIVLEAISNGNTPAGLRAREMCAEAARKRAEELRGGEADEGDKKTAGGLSVEALAAHTQGAGQVAVAQSVAQSLVSNRKTSTISDQKSKEKHHGSNVGGKTGIVASSGEGGSQVPSSPPPLAAPIARRLSISASIAGEEGLMSTILPEELLVEILAERLMLNDCQRGMVFDGLETLFSQNMFTTAHAVLKALNNRKYIFFLSLKLDFSMLKEQERKEQEDKEQKAKEAEEHERRCLEDMSEDEYDALTEQEKAEVDLKRLEIKKERIRKENEERLQREREEQEAREAEQRRLEEENKNKKKKKSSQQEKDAKKAQLPGKSQDRMTGPKSQEGKKGHLDSEHVGKSITGVDRPESHATERGESAADPENRKKHKGSKEGKRPISNEKLAKEGDPAVPEEPVKDPAKEAELLLMQRFRTFDHSFKDISELVEHWERSTVSIRPPTPSDGTDNVDDPAHHPMSGRKTKKGGWDKKAAKDRDDLKLPGRMLEKDSEVGDDGEAGSEQLTDEERKERRLEEGIGIPHLILDCSSREKPHAVTAIETGKLPSIDEVLDGLGLGPKGPPIPPPAGFAVVPYPVKRHAPPGADSGHYIFVASSPDDPNISTDDKAGEPDMDEDKSLGAEAHKEEAQTPAKGKGKDKDKELKGDKKDKRKSSARSRAGLRRSSSSASPPPPGAPTPGSEITEGSAGEAALHESKNPKLGTFRWVIPAQGEVVLRLRFVSKDLGQFDQTLNFEIVGTRRRYQLYCRGICAFPTISREPRIVFPHRQKSKKGDIVHKKYILTTETFEFGPLLVSKSRDRYKEGKFPENMEKLAIKNTSPLEADISFCFLHDSKAETYLLDPPTMLLKPGEQEELTLWAYPNKPGAYEDSLVCCIKENPEPVVFKLLCHGVRPELELDKKQIHFDKVLLHRKDTKTLYLRNSTLLPVAWRLNGLENLGDDFSVSQESGVIDPISEFPLHAYFRAMKPVTTTRKAIRLEVTDADNIFGLVQTENIQVHAEAYDVALDMSFPKGTDGGIDFDVIRVLDEQKQQCSMKNKGKYEIGYTFTFEPTPECPEDVCKMFSVVPQKGTLSPVDRPAQIQVIFRSNREVTVKDQPVLRCQVIEPNIVEGGETIASIPIKLTVRSVFSKYTILPVNDINFGSMLVNSKKTRTFTLENKGDRFEFKYSITKMVKETAAQDTRRSRGTRNAEKRARSRDGSSSGRSANRPKRAESISEEVCDGQPASLITPPVQPGSSKLKRRLTFRQDMGGGGTGGNQARLVLGMFNIFPAFGFILPGGHQSITVDCIAEFPGRCEEDIAIEVTGRDPTDHPGGIPYRLVAEACQQTINVTDMGSVFEEHRIVKNLSVWQHSNSAESGGVYGEDENKFVFNNVLVGAKAKARIKITNTNKVPCDVVFTVKVPQSKHSSKFPDVFDVEPSRAQIPSHSHIYATVTFSPPSMMAFNATFEAAVEGVPQNQAKGRNLVFEVSGEGNLPRVSIAKPVIRNKKGQPLLLFRKILIGRSQSLPLAIVNDGMLPSKVDIDMADPDNVFTLRPTGDTQAVITEIDGEDGKRKPHAASVIISVGETASFDVVYRPVSVVRSAAHVKLSVVNNQYEDTIIQMVGEGYEDEVTLDNIHSLVSVADPELEEGNMADDDIQAAKSNHIKFGDVYVNESRTLSFSMTNHSKTDVVRFQWPEHPQLKFSPQVGHLHPTISKDMTVTFKSDAPKTFAEHEVACRVGKITFDKPLQEVAEWDDRIRTVKWVDISPSPLNMADSGGKVTPVGQPPATAGRPAKKKVVETEPEPSFQEVPESVRTVELLVSAISDYCKYRCKLDSVHFKDTLMLQTRVYEFELSNDGSVSMNYNWQILMDDSTQGTRSIAFAEESRPPTSHALVRPTTPGRPHSAASSLISDTTYCPFTIEPETGTILPKKSSKFTLKFSPLDVQEFEARLICSISNLEEGKQGPGVDLRGRSLMPYCHFELKDSDYISGARRNPELRGPGGAPPGTTLDQTTRVMEFVNIGVGVKNVYKFSIVNPTNQNYQFMWCNEDEPDPKKIPEFVCLATEGVIRSGKKANVGFEFTSSQLGLVESFWRFVIPEHNISVPFVLVGDTHDPNIALERSHLNFKSLLIGHEAVEEVNIINSEDVPFHFHFAESSCFSAGHSAVLKVVPMSGTVLPRASLPVQIYFTPNSEKEVNFNLVCNVKKKTLPLTLNIKAEGYSMNCLVLCEDSMGNKIELSTQGLNEINFGQVEVNEKAARNIYIVNSGKFNFDYSWELKERSGRKDNMVAINPSAGGVMFGERQRCQLSFCPPGKTSLRGCELTLKISNGPTYNVVVTGNGMPPGIHLSLSSHQFGPCFIHRAGMPTHTATLIITNRDKKDISVDCLYGSTAHLNHNFEARVIQPGKSVPVMFTFYPREAIKYHEVVTFEINGLSKQSVDFYGQGTEMKIEVADSRNKIVKFGALRVGQAVKRHIPIINNSPAPITFNLVITPTTAALQDKNILKLSPTSEITLPAKGGTAKVDLVFSPKSRIPPFTEEVMLECAGMYQPLFVVTGSCQGIEINLDSDAIPFGAVVQKSSSTRKLIMTNTGDIGSRFKWDVKKFSPDFSISPVEGYISPGMEVPFDVVFHPQEVNQDIRYDNMKCSLEGSKPLKLTLTGMCIAVPPIKEVLHFSTHVRQKDTRNLMVANRTNMHWNLRPVIDGEFWTGPDAFSVEPQQTKGYELTYRPLIMTADGKKHTGTVFFPLPDGTGLMYNVTGSAEAPKPAGRFTRDVPCKTTHTETLTVSNWLKKPQRFTVKTEYIRPERLDPGTTVKGLDYIDVPGSSKREYKMTFYAHKEGVSQIKVVFINEKTNEFQFYEVTFRAMRPDIIKMINLSTPVRQSVPHTITLENPLNYAVTFAATCNVSEVLMPNQLQVPSQSEGSFNFEYLPLKVGETKGKLEFVCNDLGLYMYDLDLKATNAGPERALYFRTCLGTSHSQVARFLNFAKQKTDYTCKVSYPDKADKDNPDFHVDKQVAAAPSATSGTEVAVEVVYEPARIGESRGILTVSSSLGGDYTFPLFGTSVVPKPQGPFIIKAGSTTPITFRNVFASTTAFLFQVDNPLFHVAKSGETVRSRKDHRIVVGFDGSDSGSKAAVMGKLTVSCAKSAGGTTSAQWVYYLKGVSPDR